MTWRTWGESWMPVGSRKDGLPEFSTNHQTTHWLQHWLMKYLSRQSHITCFSCPPTPLPPKWQQKSYAVSADQMNPDQWRNNGEYIYIYIWLCIHCLYNKLNASVTTCSPQRGWGEDFSRDTHLSSDMEPLLALHPFISFTHFPNIP